ncbi:potassium-transporting ATPase subunit C, partial [Bacillus cereus]|uniref:potassium-transporting ATPase subunit C n=1 Tax=Bacillus cereus TaxID=1396 RepID=UPI0028442B77
LIHNDKNEGIGTKLIGQNTTYPRYFKGRASSIYNNTEASGSNNYEPSKPDLSNRVEKRIADWKEKNQAIPVTETPFDLLTNSGSG